MELGLSSKFAVVRLSETKKAASELPTSYVTADIDRISV
jgi:hypothetical protein